MVLVNNGPFFRFFILGNIGQENEFYDILQRRNTFLGYKNKKLKKSKNSYFSKVGSPRFCPKVGHFTILVQNWPFFLFFYFRQYRPGKCVL